MKGKLLVLVLMISWMGILKSQITNLPIGINVWDGITKTITLNSRIVLAENFGFQLEAGFCPGRKYTTMSTITDRSFGYFISAGPKLIFGDEMDGYYTLGINALFASTNRNLNINVPDYYENVYETATFSDRKFGFNVQAGRVLNLGRFSIEPGGEFSMLQSRQNTFGFDYWVPGIGRMGLSDRANEKKMNWSIGVYLNVMFDLLD